MKKLLAMLVACSFLLSALTGCDPHSVKIAEKVTRSTVLVHIMVHKGEKHGGALCSGVVVSPNEVLLANHCVDMHSHGDDEDGVKLDKIWVKDYQGHAQLATIEDTDKVDDLALLQIRKALEPADIAWSQPKVGSTLFIVGMPLGMPWIVTKGIVSQVGMKMDGLEGTFFITDATVLPGNSGGGVWNDKGQLIGIVSMSTSYLGNFGAAGLGIIVDTPTMRAFLY